MISTQVTRADDTETCFQWFWKEVQWLEDHPRHATSLLLMTNPYWASNFDAFEQFGDALTQALQSATESKVEGLGFEGQIQLVFFHPQQNPVLFSFGVTLKNPKSSPTEPQAGLLL